MSRDVTRAFGIAEIAFDRFWTNTNISVPWRLKLRLSPLNCYRASALLQAVSTFAWI